MNEVDDILNRARIAQNRYATFSQEQVDEVVVACAWAIMEPKRNRALAELAVKDTGLGNAEDKFAKNHRKTLGLLRDLAKARSVGVLSDDRASGITEIARPVGVVAAITPSTNPGATPINKILNALKGGNAIILAPSPKGHSTAVKLVEFVHQQLLKAQAPRDLVQLLPAPISKEATYHLMRKADLVVATGSQANVRAAYSSGTPAFGVGAGNVAVIVDESVNSINAAAKIAKSKIFDNATSCSSENSVVIVDSVYERLVVALREAGGALLGEEEKQRLQDVMFPPTGGNKLSAAVTAQSTARICELARLPQHSQGKFLMVEESGFGKGYPFSGEKLSPVLTLYRAADFSEAKRIVALIYGFQGAGHSVGYHGADNEHIRQLATELPVARVIVNQAHAIATGGSFDNGLPFSLSMGCGTWGRNSFSDNLNYRHYLNITRIVRPIPEVVPREDEFFAAYFERHGRS